MTKKGIAFFYFAGVFTLTFGIALTIKAELGTGPFDAMLVGLYENFGLTVGSWEFILGIFMVFINAFVMKSRPDFLALITAAVVGFGIDVWLYILGSAVFFEGLFMKSFALIVGLYFCGLGVALYLQSDFALTPVDRTMQALQYVSGWSVTIAKTVLSFLYLGIAFLLGGPIWIGTLLSALLSGKLIYWTLPFAQKVKSAFD